MAIVTAQNLTDWLASVGLSDVPGVQATALAYAISEAQRYCGRGFTYDPADAGADVARTFAGDDTPTLIIDDLLAITSLSVAGSAIGSGSYRLEAAGSSPYLYATRLASDLVTTDGNTIGRGLSVWSAGSTITITGQWGYAATTPEPVIEAVCMLAACRLLSGDDWSMASIKRTSVLAVTVERNPDGLAKKRKEALDLLRPFRRLEREPHL